MTFPNIFEIQSQYDTVSNKPQPAVSASWGRSLPGSPLPVSLGVPQKRVRGAAQVRTDELQGTLMAMRKRNNTVKGLERGRPGVVMESIHPKSTSARVNERSRDVTPASWRFAHLGIGSKETNEDLVSCPANSRHKSVIPTGTKRSGGTLCFDSAIPTGTKRSGGTLCFDSVIPTGAKRSRGTLCFQPRFSSPRIFLMLF